MIRPEIEEYARSEVVMPIWSYELAGSLEDI